MGLFDYVLELVLPSFPFRNAFRARPINDGVRPLKPLSVEKKPLTKPEPFKLTETRPKPAAPEQSEEEHVVRILNLSSSCVEEWILGVHSQNF